MTTAFHSALYAGTLMHARHDELARRAFSYRVYMASLDLDEIAALDRQLRLFSHRGFNVMSFDARDYAATLAPNARAGREGPSCSADGALRELRDALAALRATNGLPTPAATRLVTNLRVAGYTFNPVSFFLDFDDSGRVCGAIAEVNNTYGGRHRYVLGPASRVPGRDGARVGFRHTRELFVSPFLHGEVVYDFWFDTTLDGGALAIEMTVSRPSGARVFTARMTGARTRLSDRSIAIVALRYPLMTAQVIGLIHWQALKLRVAGVPYRRPDVDHRPRRDNTALR